MNKLAAEDIRALDAPDNGQRHAEGSALSDLVLSKDRSGIVLELGDLIANDHGEVVLFNDSAVQTIVLQSSARMVSQGLSKGSQTKDGQSIEGYKYCKFDNGVTIYYPDGLELILKSA